MWILGDSFLRHSHDTSKEWAQNWALIQLGEVKELCAFGDSLPLEVGLWARSETPLQHRFSSMLLPHSPWESAIDPLS